MKLAKETLHVTLYSLYSGTPKLWLGLQFFIKEESRTAVFKILVRTLPSDIYLNGVVTHRGQIHIKTLNFFNNICLLPETTIEKRLARRQVAVKTAKSASWFIDVKKLLWTYDLQDIETLLDSPVPRPLW